MRRSLALLLLISFVVIPAAQAKQLPQSKSLALINVTVIDVAGKDAKSALKPDQTVVVTGDRIVAVGRTGRVKAPAGAQVIDATGKYLIPGLWDMHVHLSHATELSLPTLVANGVLGVRDMGGDFDQIDGWRRGTA